MEFYPPMTPGEWVQTTGAGITALIGLALVIAPGFFTTLVRGRKSASFVQAATTTRAHAAGFILGFGLSALLLQQPLIYLALGASWGFSVLGQLLSLLLDRNLSTANIITLILKSLLAACLILSVFGVFG
jgi:hypothetical protein